VEVQGGFGTQPETLAEGGVVYIGYLLLEGGVVYIGNHSFG
jgi:hypothetical protein